jgi:sorbitol-specific phosphotransferase system component IIA
MQRRVAAVYFVFFLVMGASAYSVIAVAEQPAIDVEGESYTEGDTLAVDGREYVVANVSVQSSGDGGGHGGGDGGEEHAARLQWTNESARFTATLSNDTVVTPAEASFPDQRAFESASLEDGDTVTFNGSEATVSIPDDEAPRSFSLGGPSVDVTLAYNDTLTYQGQTMTVAGITPDAVTLVAGSNYRVLTPNESDPSGFRMVQRFNVSERLAADPAVENRTVTRDDGREYVVFAANGSTERLSEYLPTPDVGRLTEGDTMTVRGNETTVANVTAERVVVEWTGPTTNTVELAEGENVTLNGQRFVVHFEGDSVTLSPDIDGYQNDLARQDVFKERQNGLWGVTLLSGFAAMLIVGLAYLPVRG